jgi:hypothetical protein
MTVMEIVIVAILCTVFVAGIVAVAVLTSSIASAREDLAAYTATHPKTQEQIDVEVESAKQKSRAAP